MILTYARCNVSVMPLRSEPSHRAEQTSQMLFGEKAEVMELENEWARIRCNWDDYEGWCKASQLSFIHQKEHRKPTKFLSVKNHNKILFEDSEMWLPTGSDLPGISAGKITAGFFHGKFKGRKTPVKKLEFSEDHIRHTVLSYMHAPYQWGGRTVAGIDCSGLTQMAYKMCGIKIPRDAAQQALEGETLDFLQNARCGDLAFFDNAEGRIVHVGMLLDAATIVHATEVAGRVVMDRIDPGGIISTCLKKRTHNLRLVKRYQP